MTEPSVSEYLLVTEIARQREISVRTVERWIARAQAQGLQARKATPEQLLHLLADKRLSGLPPKGVWLIHKRDLPLLDQQRKPVGYPKGQPRRRRSSQGSEGANEG